MSLALGCKLCQNAEREWQGAEIEADEISDRLMVHCRGCGALIYHCTLPDNLKGKSCEGCGDPGHGHGHGTPEAS